MNLFLMAAAILATFSCGKSQVNGGVRFSLGEGSVDEVVTKGQVSDYAALPASGNFALTLKNSLGATVYNGLLSAWDESTQLQAGNYTVSASYGSPSAEGPSKPYFEGSATFAVTGGATTSVSIPVTLGNCLVKIVCTEAFQNYYPTRVFHISTPETSAGFDYDGTAVFVAYQWSIGGTLTSQGGTAYTLPERSWSGDPATCYTVKYDVSNTGGVSITISFSDTTETVTLEDLELNS